MVSLRSLVGNTIGRVTIVKRLEDKTIGEEIHEQYLVKCSKCSETHPVIRKIIEQRRGRFAKGCYICTQFGKRPKGNFVYGVNENGFKDKSIIIKLEEKKKEIGR